MAGRGTDPKKLKNGGRLTTKDGKPTKLARSIANKAANAKVQKEELARIKAPKRKRGAVVEAKKDPENPLIIPGTKSYDKTKVYAVICQLVASNAMPLQRTLNLGYTDEEGRNWPLPAANVVRVWLYEDDEFFRSYMRAKSSQAVVYAEDIEEIADSSRNDYMEREIEEGKFIPIVDHEHIKRTQLRIDTRKWYAERFAPKILGAAVKVTGPEGGPIQTQALPMFTPEQLAAMTPEELELAIKLAEKHGG